MKEKISVTIDRGMLKRIDSFVDNVVIRNRSQAIEHLVKSSLGDVRTAVILSGGSEESLRISENEYRPTARLGKTTLVEMAVKKLRQSSFKKIFIIARSGILTEIFSILKDGSSYGAGISYIEESDSEGSASSLRLAESRVNGPFLVVFGDLIFSKISIEELWKQHIMNNAIATIMLTTSSTPSKKGIVKMEGTNIMRFEQKPKESDTYIGFSSIFAAEPEIFRYRGKSLELNVFPRLAEKGLLQGHISSENEIHIHSSDDVKRFLRQDK